MPIRRADDEGEQRQALWFGQASGDAEVEECDFSRGKDEQVPSVKVTVKDAVHHGALEKSDHAASYDGFGVYARGAHPFDVREVEAAQTFHDEHPPGDERGVGPRDDEVALAELGEGRGDVEHVLGLQTEIEFLDDGFGEELHQRRGIGQCGNRDPAHQMGSQPRHDGEVLAHPLGDRGPLDLHHHFGPVEQPCRVDLGYGRGGRVERWSMETNTSDSGRPSSSTKHSLDDGPRFRWHPVPAPLELRYEFGGKMPSPEATI